jgi:hypothetical protein
MMRYARCRMTETFVDLTYRGLSLGRRVKLTQVHKTTGYLEHPTPMPVGTAVSIATDEGLTFDAVVDAIHEQVGGSDKAPGMRVKPTFASDQLTTWWNARVHSDAPVPAPTPEKVTVRPRTATVPEPNPAAALAAASAPTFTKTDEQAPLPGMQPPSGPVTSPLTTIPGTVFTPPARGGSATTVMNAVDQDLLAQLTKSDEVEHLTRRTGEHAIVDDGMRTSVMDAVDPAALGLDVSMFSATPEDGDGGDDEPSSAESGPIAAQGDDKKPKGTVKKRKKRR